MIGDAAKRIFRNIECLNGNMLKIIALVTMTVDHLGLFLFPDALWMRIVGRLAYPIFAYMIAEGCHYTRSRVRYAAGIALIAILYQTVTFLVAGDLQQTVLTSFLLSILLISVLDAAVTGYVTDAGRWLLWLAFFALVAFSYWLAVICPDIPVMKQHLFHIDYGFYGILLPVLIYVPYLFTREKSVRHKLFSMALMTVGLMLVTIGRQKIQWFSLIAVLLIALYNGERGKLDLKYLFYIYYPVHLGIIALVARLLK